MTTKETQPTPRQMTPAEKNFSIAKRNLDEAIKNLQKADMGFFAESALVLMKKARNELKRIK